MSNLGEQLILDRLDKIIKMLEAVSDGLFTKTTRELPLQQVSQSSQPTPVDYPRQTLSQPEKPL